MDLAQPRDQPLLCASPQNLLAAGIGVGILTILLIASVAEDAMASVPRSLRRRPLGSVPRR